VPDVVAGWAMARWGAGKCRFWRWQVCRLTGWGCVRLAVSGSRPSTWVRTKSDEAARVCDVKGPGMVMIHGLLTWIVRVKF